MYIQNEIISYNLMIKICIIKSEIFYPNAYTSDALLNGKSSSSGL